MEAEEGTWCCAASNAQGCFGSFYPGRSIRTSIKGCPSMEEQLREKGLSIRRLNRARMKKKATAVVSKWGCEVDAGGVGRLADNLAACSCYMCGNPRKWFKKKTVQELKSDM